MSFETCQGFPAFTHPDCTKAPPSWLLLSRLAGSFFNFQSLIRNKRLLGISKWRGANCPR